MPTTLQNPDTLELDSEHFIQVISDDPLERVFPIEQCNALGLYLFDQKLHENLQDPNHRGDIVPSLAIIERPSSVTPRAITESSTRSQTRFQRITPIRLLLRQPINYDY